MTVTFGHPADAINSNNRTRPRCGCPKGEALAPFLAGKRYSFLPGSIAEIVFVVISVAVAGLSAARRLPATARHADTFD